jgi:hypothetical protein
MTGAHRHLGEENYLTAVEELRAIDGWMEPLLLRARVIGLRKSVRRMDQK